MHEDPGVSHHRHTQRGRDSSRPKAQSEYGFHPQASSCSPLMFPSTDRNATWDVEGFEQDKALSE